MKNPCTYGCFDKKNFEQIKKQASSNIQGAREVVFSPTVAKNMSKKWNAYKENLFK